MKEFFRSAVRRGSGAFFGFLGINKFVYISSIRARVAWPDIKVLPVELYGQCGEDLIILALLEARALSKGLDLEQQHYLEVGGNHPFGTSPTYLLHKQLGMSGAIVEANEKLLADLRKGRPKDTIVYGAVQAEDVETVMLSISKLSEISSLDHRWVEDWAGGTVGEAARVEVPALRLNQIIRDFLADEAPCFLSVDVEGLDLELLKDLDFGRYRPWFVQAEPSDPYLPGNTDRMIEHMRSVGYGLIARTRVNLIFGDLLD